MRRFSCVGLVAIFLAGCVQSKPAPVEQVPPTRVDIGGPQGGVHVSDPADGTRVDVGGGSGVRVTTPESRVDVP